MRGPARPFADVQAVVFDYGNTIVPFGHDEIRRCDEVLLQALARIFGSVDAVRVREIRGRNRLMPYAGDPPAYRENDLPALTRDLVCELYGRPPSASELADLLAVRFGAFVDAVALADGAAAVLAQLRATRRIGLLSNYPDGAAIRASLGKVGLADAFDAVVVSGDLGFVKPHPAMFDAMLEQLGVDAAGALHVGDNWLADVQGAKRAGWRVVHMTRWEPPEHFAPAPGDALPDAAIRRLDELAGLLA
jgi:HAD superfamily hydrolase (TIGR01509 family)